MPLITKGVYLSIQETHLVFPLIMQLDQVDQLVLKETQQTCYLKYLLQQLQNLNFLLFQIN
ncbi:hypothetical protein pb186bvf_009822 [Paramecium bursaria]